MLAKIEKRPFVRQKQCPLRPQSGHLIGLQRMAAESPKYGMLQIEQMAAKRKFGLLALGS